MANSEVRSEVAGSVWKIETKVDDIVGEGDTLIIIESMKMEIPVLATDSGRVAEIRVAEGEAVAEGQIVVVIVT